jgi:aminopeptidase-like protein
LSLPSAAELFDLTKRLFPITRSITGNGVRESLKIVQEYVPDFKIREFPSDTPVYDWTIPKEWNIEEAFIADTNGHRIINFEDNGLHVMGYSTPINEKLSFGELLPHLHSLPNLPKAIPYRTSYFKEDWGFCLSQDQLNSFDQNAEYHVVIKATLEPGHLTLADSILNGTSDQEFLISTYCCHPWMANDNLSGIVVTTFLHRWLAQNQTRHSYRFVILPETIGAITYLAHNEVEMKNINGGFVISCCGGPGQISYKDTFLGNHLIDRAAKIAFRDAGVEPWLRPFAPDGSDERQYSMPAFRIPVATISKDKYYDYDFYHTSLDNLDFVTGDNLLQTLSLYIDCIKMLECNATYKSLMPYCEPQLGKRGLYPQTGGAIKQSSRDPNTTANVEAQVDALTWVMFLADGSMDLLDMAERSNQPFSNLLKAAQDLIAHDLIQELPSKAPATN